jgi:hypothetical protein
LDFRSDGKAFRNSFEKVLQGSELIPVGEDGPEGIMVADLNGSVGEGRTIRLEYIATKQGERPQIAFISEVGGRRYRLRDGVFAQLGVSVDQNAKDTWSEADYAAYRASHDAKIKAAEVAAAIAEKRNYERAYNQASADMRREFPQMYGYMVKNFAPGVSDVYGIKEFLQKPTVIGGVSAVIGFVPLIGDAGSIFLRNAPLDDVPKILGAALDYTKTPLADVNLRIDAGDVPADAIIIGVKRADDGLLPSGVGGTGAAYNKETGQGLYVLRDEQKNIVYVGRGDAPARIQTHADSIDKGDFVGQQLYDNNLTKAQAKGLEQRLIEQLGGAKSFAPNTPLLNKINSYSPTNPNAPIYRDAVTDRLWQDLLGKIGR